MSWLLLALWACGDTHPGPGRTHIWVSKRALPAGTVLTMEEITLLSAPDALAPAGVLRQGDDVLGRRLIEAVPEYDILRNERLSAPWTDQEGLTTTVQLAVRPVPAGTVLALSDLRTMPSRPEDLPLGTFLTAQELVGRTVCSALMVDEIVRKERLDVNGRCP